MSLSTAMKQIQLDKIPYQHRHKAAWVLVTKAHQLGGLVHPDDKVSDPKLLVALAYYDMALALMKPFDPNYPTLVNWKCNLLAALGQYETAIEWHQEIVRISDETDGLTTRNATAQMAMEMIQRYAGRKNEPLASSEAEITAFDLPPYAMMAEEFCRRLCEGHFKKAQAMLSPKLRDLFPLAKLRADWQQMTRSSQTEPMSLALEQHLLDWPDRNPDDIGWCYVSVTASEFSEAVTVVVSRMPDHSERITHLEFGRP